jgi:hypothetical protein
MYTLFVKTTNYGYQKGLPISIVILKNCMATRMKLSTQHTHMYCVSFMQWS